LQQVNGKLVLVADDEAALRELTKSTLESHGYKVLLATDGNEAVTVFGQHSDEIDLVLTDMVMPVMDGIMTIQALREIKPDVKIIAISGYIDDARYVDLLGDVDAVMRKPFELHALMKTIDRILASPSEA